MFADGRQTMDTVTSTSWLTRTLSAATQRHIINLGTGKIIVFKNLTLLFVFVCVNNLFNNLFNFKNEPLADEDAVDIAWSTNKPNQIVVVSLLGEVLVLQTCRKRYHQPSTIKIVKTEMARGPHKFCQNKKNPCYCSSSCSASQPASCIFLFELFAFKTISNTFPFSKKILFV